MLYAYLSSVSLDVYEFGYKYLILRLKSNSSGRVHQVALFIISNYVNLGTTQHMIGTH